MLRTDERFNRYHFQGQHEGEQVFHVIHRHWFNILMHFLGIGLLVLALFIVFRIIPAFLPVVFSALSLPLALAGFIESGLMIMFWLYFFFVWIDYYFDVWIITSERIVNVEQKGFFRREISELKFGNIQDVTANVSGLIPTMLNFGDVFVQTAAEQERFVFRQIPDPFAIKDAVMKLSQGATNTNLRTIAAALRERAAADPPMDQKDPQA